MSGDCDYWAQWYHDYGADSGMSTKDGFDAAIELRAAFENTVDLLKGHVVVRPDPASESEGGEKEEREQQD
jgi:hypothetical protein